MYLFEKSDNDMIYFIFANILVLKAMHDRGYNVTDIPYSEPILTDCLDIIFNRTEWEDAEIPEKYEKLADEYGSESEEYAIITDFLERRHYVLHLYLNDLKEIWPFLSSEQTTQLKEIIDRIAINPAEELVDFFPDYGYYDWQWLKEDNTVVGIELKFYDVPQYQEVPVPSLELLNFLEFVDAVKSFRKELLECTSPAA